MKIYARNYGSDSSQGFRPVEYNIPANYVGCAFTADNAPPKDTVNEAVAHEKIPQDTQAPSEALPTNEADSCHKDEELPCGKPQKENLKESGAPRESLLRSLLSRFERGFEFDDLLLLGLILLLLQSGNGEKGNKDETVLILAFLFLAGF